MERMESANMKSVNEERTCLHGGDMVVLYRITLSVARGVIEGM